MVVPEALSFGLPVVCFDNIGPGEFINENCGIKIPYLKYQETINAFADSLTLLFTNSSLRKKLSDGATKHFSETFSWDVKGVILKDLYNKLLTTKSLNDEKNYILSPIQ